MSYSPDGRTNRVAPAELKRSNGTVSAKHALEESKSSTHHVSYNDTSVLSLEVGSRWLEIIEETEIALSVTTKEK